MNILANIIAVFHLLFIIFITTTPFVTDNPFILLYYCFMLLFVMFHWYLNDDTCVLTLIEAKLRGQKKGDTFMGKLLKPIYNVSSDEIKYLSYFLLIFAFLRIRLWEKERYELICRTLYIKYKLIYNKLYKKDDDSNNNLNNKMFITLHVLDFFMNPFSSQKKLNTSVISE
jgi:hypothetical protein